MISQRTAKRLVKAGAAWLDENVADWLDKIDEHELNISSECHCIGGQLCGDYGSFVNVYEMKTPVNFGFMPPVDMGFYFTNSNALTDAWKALIAERRAERAIPVTERELVLA
jgi:hypothetical protein